MCIFSKLSSDQLSSSQHIGPLVIATKLHITAVFLIQHVEVVALHDHVVELQKA